MTIQQQQQLDRRLFTSDLGAFLFHDAEVISEAIGGHEPPSADEKVEVLQ
jgi:hypothetical protein